MSKIPVAHPRLPSAARIEPHLSRIDGNRWYSNWGPVLSDLERRLAGHFGVSPEELVVVANGTVGLTLAHMAQETPRGSLCMMPSWTFTATPLAAMAAGLVPYFVDVDRDGWALTPEIARRALETAPGPVGCVVAVAPFGAPLDGRPWDAFAREVDIPVLIDAAAAVDSWRPARSPAMVSLHATKLLGLGEGGLIVARDPDLIRNIRQRANFGFYGSRDTRYVAMNGKLSEYGAAVGLAALDAYADTRAEFMAVAAAYRRRLAAVPGIRLQDGFGEDWVSTTLNVVLPHHDIAKVAERLGAAGIETRAWWGMGAHRQTALAGLPRAELPNTEWLAAHTIGLPFFVDMAEREVELVCGALADCLVGAACC